MWRYVLVVALAIVIQGCSAKSHFSAVQEDVKLTVGKTAINGVLPIEAEIPRTTFGRYPVKITKEGYAPIYGFLPLKVSGGMIAVDALLFAPAAFFNVQKSLPFYEIDMDSGVIKYKEEATDEWTVYPMTEAQKAQARSFFGD